MAHVPSKRMKEVAEDLERIFNASNREDAFTFIEETMERAEIDIPEVAKMLEEGKEDIPAVYVLPRNTGNASVQNNEHAGKAARGNPEQGESSPHLSQ